MSNSVYYKATDEDGNTVLRHGWKKHKYLYIKNGKYVYPEDLYKNVKQRVKNYFTSPGTDTKVSKKSYGKKEELERQKALESIKKHKQWSAKHRPFVRDGKKEELERQKALESIKKHKQWSAKHRPFVRDGKKEELERQKALESIKKHKQWSAKHRPFVRDGKKEELERQKALESIKKHKQWSAKHRPFVRDGKKEELERQKALESIKKHKKSKTSTPYKGPTSATRAQKAQHEKDFQKRVRAINKVYKSAKKKAKKVNRTFNKVKRAGKAYIDYLTK